MKVVILMVVIVTVVKVSVVIVTVVKVTVIMVTYLSKTTQDIDNRCNLLWDAFCDSPNVFILRIILNHMWISPPFQ